MRMLKRRLSVDHPLQPTQHTMCRLSIAGLQYGIPLQPRKGRPERVAVYGILQPQEYGLGGELRRGWRAIAGTLKYRIVPLAVGIIAILVTQGNLKRAAGGLAPASVLDLSCIALIGIKAVNYLLSPI
jgi:hypothetical protein